MRNHEVTNKQLLLNEKGYLNEPGWSKSQVMEYKRNMIKSPAYKIKEWDYYLVMGKDFGAAFTISDDGYVGLQSVSLLSFGDIPWEHTETVLNPFPMGKLKLPENSSEGETVFENKRLYMSFKPSKGKRTIMCKFTDFWDKKDLTAQIELEQPDMDTMVIATPWTGTKAFYYNQKINCMRASGYVDFDGRRYEFDPKTDFGTLDWGRGVWTYDNTWKWGSGNCDIKGKAFGFNIGYGFGDTSKATENVLFYDGKVSKLDDITFNFSEDDYMKPWTFTSSDGRFEMEFEPVLDRSAKLDLKVILSDQHQVFGRMTGNAVLDDGTVIEVPGIMCFAENVHNKY